MYVSIVFNTEYMNVGSRIRWFLKSAFLSMRDDCLVITHEYMKNHLEQLVQDCGNTVYADYDIPEITPDDVKKLDICYIPDALFDAISAREGTQTGQLLYLYNTRDRTIEETIIKAIKRKLAEKKEKLDFILNSLHVFASVKYISDYFGVPLIPYVFSCVRKAHGYNQTLYMAHCDSSLFFSKVAESLYCRYNADSMPYPILDKMEVLALLGKYKNLHLIPLVQSEGVFEMGIVGECFKITPQLYQNESITDDDLYFEAEKFYKRDMIITRLHPTQMDQSGITRKHMKNDPISFVLCSKRIATVQSQMIMKGVMWNRVPCVLGNALPYAFLFSKDFQSRKPLSDSDLNFILFVYFIPDCCMFNPDYWKWRLTDPSPSEIFRKHLDAIIDQVGYTKGLLEKKSSRLERILQCRNLDKNEIAKICSCPCFRNVNYDFLSSRIRATYYDETYKDYYCLNSYEKGELSSCFFIQRGEEVTRIQIFLFDDVDGFAKIKSLYYGDSLIEVSPQEDYWPKNSSVVSFDVSGIDNNSQDAVIVKVIWEAEKFEEKFIKK